MKMNIKTIATLIVLSLMSATSQADVIDFEGTVVSQYEYEVENTTGTPIVRLYGDYKVSVWAATYLPNNYISYPLSDEQIAALPASNRVYIHPNNGSASVISQRLIVERNAGTPFTATSVDIAEKVDNINVGQVSIRGYSDSDTYIEQTFDADLSLGFETLTFDAAWTNLIKLEFRVDGSNQMHFDNIVVN